MKAGKAFTLIEILVVMVVMGVVAAVAIPNYSNYMVNSKIQSVENNLRSIGVAQEKYYEDRGAYYTSANGVANDFGSINSNLSLSMASVNDGFNYLCAASGSCCASNATYPTAAGTSISVDKNGNLAVAAGAICAGPGFTCSGANPCGIFGACYAVSGCNNQCNSAEVNDVCGVCNGNAGTTCPTNETCSGDACVCTGTMDACGVCGGTAGATCPTNEACSGDACVCNGTVDVCGVCKGTAGVSCPTNETCTGDACVCHLTTDLCGTCGGTCTAANNENCTAGVCACGSGYNGTPGSCVANCTPDNSYVASSSSCCNNDEDPCGLCGGNGSECSSGPACTNCCGCQDVIACDAASCAAFMTGWGCAGCGNTCTVVPSTCPDACLTTGCPNGKTCVMFMPPDAYACE